MKKVIVAGQEIPLMMLEKSALQGVYVDALLAYTFYKGSFQGHSFLLLAPKRKDKLTPSQYQKTATLISGALDLPCVFLFDSLLAYERNRLIEKGVYFIVSHKYVFLPFLIINARASKSLQTSWLSPAAQYMVLYHIQKKSLNDSTLSDMEECLPYKYVTLSRAVRQLEKLRVLSSTIGKNREKRLHFESEGEALWNTIEPHMQHPIKKIWYADNPPRKGILSGISALACYSSLNPNEQENYAVDEKEFERASSSRELRFLNENDGRVRIEVWRYPPIEQRLNSSMKAVDKLSLYLMMRDDKDPRVEKELEKVIHSIW